MDSQEVGVANSEPSVFIVKYNYEPSLMSPNPNHDQELSLVAGDYIYVFGDMDGDGFYHAQLTTGEMGLAPSNFIEIVEDGGKRTLTSKYSPIPNMDGNDSLRSIFFLMILSLTIEFHPFCDENGPYNIIHNGMFL